MILHWARKESIKYEIEHFEQEILKEENAEHHDDVTEEEIQEHIDNLNIHLKHSRDELKMLDEDMENLKEEIESGEIDNWEDMGDDFEVDELWTIKDKYALQGKYKVIIQKWSDTNARTNHSLLRLSRKIS